MKETRSRRWISLLLTAVMLLSLIPAAVMPAAAANKTEDSYHRILHLDCGRKYFTKDWIKALINEMEDAGYNQLQLAFGNDGLRFLLDDMSVTVGDTTYSSKDVTSGIQAGNKAYYDAGAANELTESEMTEIIAHAQKNGIEVVPLLNSPGHMDAILTAMTKLGISNPAYSTSKTTVDLGNGTAVAFTQALVKKYVDYFKEQGCGYFNLGADEYANDINENPQFSAMLNNGYYAKFVDYVNTLAEYVVNNGMTPRCFNDGVYYNQKTNYGTPNEKLQICYWSSGWSGFNVAPASFLAGKNFDMINTNGDYYYVLGKNDNFDSGYSYASNFSNSTFMSSTISNPVGSMFCIWCDFPNAETETEVAQKTRLVLRAMAARMQDQSIDTINTEVVSGGFNADGTINTTGGTAESATVTDGTTNVTVTAPGLTSVAVTAGTASESNGVVSKTYRITLNGGAYTGKATVKIPYDTAFNGYTTLYGMVDSDRFDVTVENGYFVCAVPHFSDVTLYGEERAVSNDGQEISIEVGKTAKVENVTADAGDYITGNTAYIATAKVETTTTEGTLASITKVPMNSDGTYTGVLSDGNGNYMVLSSNGDISSTTDPARATTFTVTRSTTSYGSYYSSTSYTIYANGYYLTVSTSGYWTNRQYTLATTKDSTDWDYSSSSGFDKSNGYLYWTSSGWAVSSNVSSNQAHLYTVTPAVPGESKSTLTFTGMGEGTTTATVGGTTYTINVTAPKTEETKTLNFGNTLTGVPSGAVLESKAGDDVVTVSGNTVTAGQTAGTATVTFVTKNAGGKVTARYTYTINVTEVDLSTVAPLTIEYWITNADLTINDSNYYSVSAAASGMYSENGVDVSTFLPENATKENRTLDYWRCRLLDTMLGNTSASGTEKQTKDAGDDETCSGVGFTKVRYYNGAWAVYTEDNQWVTVESKYQLVAYYMEYVDVANELYVNAADWGKKADGTTSGDYLPANKYCSVSIQVVYADGTTNPASTNAPELNRATIGYGYWDGGRGIGTLNLKGLENHQIWKIEAETGSITANFGSGDWGNMTATSFSWDNNPMTVFEDTDNPVDSYTLSNNAKFPSKDGYYQNLMWDENQEAILITVYVKAKATEDSLTVIYQDEKFNAELYRYSITVPANVDFKENIISKDNTTTSWNNLPAFGSDRKNVNGYGIKNTLDVAQWFQTDLTQVPEAVGKYHSDLYEYTGSEISDDGKTLYLYYNIDTSVLKPNFVADFGLPIQFPLTDLVDKVSTVKDVTVTQNTKYGKLTYDTADKMFTYTPTKTILDYDVLTISILFDGEKAATTTNVGVTAASNVLYEDSFLKVNTEKDNNYAAWTTQPTQATNTQQEAQKAGETGNVFGYDTAYASSTGNSMSSAWTINNLTSGNASKYLTTSFYGNGFDLIGTAGPDTGYVYLLLQGPANKLVIIDTSYAHGTLSQVPLAHLEGLTEGTYTVNIRAAYRAATASTTSTASTYGMNSSDPMEDVYAVMEELYQDGFEIDDIEVVGVDEAAVASTLSAETATRAAASAGTTVTIDGFRVYRSSNNESYPEAEQNVTYVNVLSNTLDNNGTFKAYTESNGTWDAKGTYESNGGPQNEVYLAKDNAIAFKVNANAKVQISARAVSGNATMTVNGATVSLNSNTEMYYEVTPKDGIITISNTGDAMVALGNLKLPAGTATAALTAEDEPAVFALLRMTSAPAEPEGPETSVFTPEKLDINVKSLNVIRNKLVTLTIITSTDVASLTVNGKTLKPTNSWLVKKGWSDEYVYVLADKVKRNENKAYEVIAYNADGAASAAKTVNG